MNPNDIKNAHFYSSNNRPSLEKGEKCGCFNCLEIFDSSLITRYYTAATRIDCLGTAICPFCGIDSVIGESSGYPITPAFLKEMQQYWFGVD